MTSKRHYRDDNTEGYTQAQLDALNAELDGRLDGIEPGSDEWHETVSRHADEVARRTPQVALASAAARALRAIPSEARAAASRANGRKGGVSRSAYMLTEEECRESIDRQYRPGAWAAGVRGWNRGVPGMISAGTYIASPRPHKDGVRRYKCIPYGNDESYKLG